MGKEIAKNLKIAFLLDGLACLPVGIVLLFFTDMYSTMIGGSCLDPLAVQVMGVTFVTYGLLNLLAFRENDWDRVAIMVVADVFYDAVGAALMIWGYFVYNLSPFVWASIIFLLFFLAVYTILYFKDYR